MLHWLAHLIRMNFGRIDTIDDPAARKGFRVVFICNGCGKVQG